MDQDSLEKLTLPDYDSLSEEDKRRMDTFIDLMATGLYRLMREKRAKGEDIQARKNNGSHRTSSTDD